MRVRALGSVLSQAALTPHASSIALCREKTRFYRSRRAGPALMLRVRRTHLEDSEPQVAAFSHAHARDPCPTLLLNHPCIHSESKDLKQLKETDLPTLITPRKLLRNRTCLLFNRMLGNFQWGVSPSSLGHSSAVGVLRQCAVHRL